MKWPALALLAAAALAIVFAPLALPDGYSVVRQSISESAAQNTPGAWCGRAGLALYGAGAVVAAQCVPIVVRNWARRWVARGLTVFGGAIVASAVRSHRPWLSTHMDTTEDLLHSTAASTAGLSITLVLLLVALSARSTQRVLASLAAVPVVCLPPLMTFAPHVAGALQRGMFATVAIWLAVVVCLTPPGSREAGSHERAPR